MRTEPIDSSREAPEPPRVEFAGDVVQQIRQHARSSMSAEICGVLIGCEENGVTRVTARIAGEGASHGGAHVTYTQDTWEHIYKIKDAEFPTQAIVGWYHSHPGFGIFLSDYDLFIHENFFSAPHQVAWVFDPHSDEEGCFGWINKKIEPLKEVTVTRQHRTPSPEQSESELEGALVDRISNAGRRLIRVIFILIIALLAFLGGFFANPYLVPHLPFWVKTFQKPTPPSVSIINAPDFPKVKSVPKPPIIKIDVQVPSSPSQPPVPAAQPPAASPTPIISPTPIVSPESDVNPAQDSKKEETEAVKPENTKQPKKHRKHSSKL